MNDDVCLAMEYNWTLTFRVKVGGGETVVIGECHYVDEKAVKFDDVISVTS